MFAKHIEDHPSHYWKSYRAMKDNFYQCTPLFDIGNDSFQRKVVEVLPKTDSLKILGIGSGKGELDCVNIRRMLSRVSCIDNTVVEPSVEAIEAYKSLLSGDLSDRVNTSWCNETYQHYRKRREGNVATGKFHFISAVHSLYYVDNDGSSIDYLIDLLQKDGVLFIIIQNDQSGFIRMFDKLAEYFGSHPVYNVTEGIVTSKLVKRLDSDDNVDYDVMKQQHKIDVSSCFEAESVEGSLVLDFLTQMVDFKSTVPKDFLQSVLDYLKTPDCSEMLSDGKIIFREDWDAIIIRKK